MVNPDNIVDVTRLIQLAVAPVFLLTAVGTIIGVLSNRLGRAVDRSRTLEDRFAPAAARGTEGGTRGTRSSEPPRAAGLWLDRALGDFARFFVGLLIAVAFVDAFIAVDMSKFIGLLFIAAMLAFILSLLVFLREIFSRGVEARATRCAREATDSSRRDRGLSPVGPGHDPILVEAAFQGGRCKAACAWTRPIR